MGGGGAITLITLLTITSLFWLAVAAAAARGGVILHNDGLHQPNISTALAGGQPAQLVLGCTQQKVDITDEDLTFL